MNNMSFTIFMNDTIHPTETISMWCHNGDLVLNEVAFHVQWRTRNFSKCGVPSPKVVTFYEQYNMPWGGGTNLLFWSFFLKNCMKLEKKLMGGEFLTPHSLRSANAVYKKVMVLVSPEITIKSLLSRDNKCCIDSTHRCPACHLLHGNPHHTKHSYSIKPAPPDCPPPVSLLYIPVTMGSKRYWCNKW